MLITGFLFSVCIYCQDYYGHVFWDQETWMFPPVLMLHTDLGKALVKTRIRTLDSAKEYASSRGYAGAMYTWESAYSGNVNYSFICSRVCV